MELLRIFILYLGILIIGCLGCDRDCESPFIPKEELCIAAKAPIYNPGAMTYGRVAGLKNCLPFLASATAYLDVNIDDQKHIGLVIETFEDWGGFYANKETIMIGSKGSGKGTWPLLKDVQFQSYWIVQDHDVSEDVYRIDTNYQKSRIIITSIDTLDKIIQGSFDARFLLDSSMPSGKNPDTVIFTECNFIARQP